MQSRLFIYTGVLTIVSTILLQTVVPAFVTAESASELREQINERQENIQKLEAEIEQYQKELVQVGKEKQTLQTAVQELDISRRKVQASINLTQARITETLSTISALEGGIGAREATIAAHVETIAGTLRSLNMQENRSLIEMVLTQDNLSNAWEDTETLRQFREKIDSRIALLNEQKLALEEERTTSEEQHTILNAQKTDLANDKYSLDLNRQAKNDLLAETKDKESNYQALLEEKRLAKIEFEKEMADYEARLQFILDPNSIPAVGKGVLRWPLANIFITQYFGNTEFAQSGAYNGSGHNGIDFRASIGTPVMTTLSGVVQATGNTDAYKGCYSYGQWVLIRHGNGLTTLYAHLSERKVSIGETVSTGQVIGYSGNTGYSTGPHLHMSVFASDAVKVVRMGDIKTKTNCANAEIPVAATSGYLNPLDYL